VRKLKIKYVTTFATAILLVLAVVFSIQMKVSDVVREDCYRTNTSFKAGERLVYKVYYNWKFVWIPAGEVVMDIKENAEDYEVKVVGTTYESYDNFFKVRDYFYSKIDKKTLLPSNFVRRVEEGDYRLFDSVAFDQNTLTAKSFHGKTKAAATMQNHKLSQCMHDLVSILYALRNTETKYLKKGDHLPVKVMFDKEIYPVKVVYNGKDSAKKIKDLGKFKTLRITPSMVAGTVFKDETKMDIWVSDDENKIPLLIESPLSVGSGKAILKSYSNLRNSFTSKIN